MKRRVWIALAAASLGAAAAPALNDRYRASLLPTSFPNASTACMSAEPMSVDSQRMISAGSVLARTAAPRARSSRSRRSCTAMFPDRLSRGAR